MNRNLKLKMGIAIALLVTGLLALVGAPFVRADDGDTAAPAATTATRPLSDWLDAQGTYCWDDGLGGCTVFDPPFPNFLAWTDPARDRIASIDYAGLVNQYYIDNSGTDLGTTMSGKVTEKALPNGQAQVQVVLNTKNALTRVHAGQDFTGDILFGHLSLEVMGGAEPGLCNSTFKLKFLNTAPGAPLPDFIQLLFFPEPGQEVTQINLKCNAKGPLRAAFGVPDGTPGRANNAQVAKLKNGVLFFTVENIILKAKR